MDTDPRDRQQEVEEEEANAFAETQLIPRRYEPRLHQLVTDSDVRLLAEEIGISPGIVVGRLHSDGLWDWRRGNRPKQKISLAEI